MPPDFAPMGVAVFFLLSPCTLPLVPHGIFSVVFVACWGLPSRPANCCFAIFWPIAAPLLSQLEPVRVMGAVLLHDRPSLPLNALHSVQAEIPTIRDSGFDTPIVLMSPLLTPRLN